MSMSMSMSILQPKFWCDKTVESARDANYRGLSTGLQLPNGKGMSETHVHGQLLWKGT